MKITWKKVIIVLIILLIIAGFSASSYLLYSKYAAMKELINDPQRLGQEQTRELLKKVGALIKLPDEEPTVVTILDKSKLSEQPFFQYAENGDRILIFTNAKRAVLYRPSLNKIIDVTGIDLGGNGAIVGTEESGNFNLLPSPAPTLPRWQPTPIETSPSATLEVPSPTPG